MERIGSERSGLAVEDGIGWDWDGPERIGTAVEDWIGVDRIGREWKGVDWNGLLY